MEVSENIWKFYQNVVNLIQKDYASANKFVEQAATSMILGHEFGGTNLNSVESYETSFVWNLTYNNQSESTNSFADLLKPFSTINQDFYFNLLIAENPFLAQEILMVCCLVEELEDENRSSLAKELLKIRGSKLQESYNSFSKMKEIIRTGWVVRNVEESYRENDAVHIMQMFALAMAYFRLDKDVSMDKQKVYETILIHEIGEILAGDIREGASGHDTKHEIEKQAVEKTFKPLTKGAYFIELWDEFEEKKTKEARFVYQLDKIDPVLKAKILDKILERDDLFQDFYNYEEKRKTFEKGKVKELFYYIKKRRREKIMKEKLSREEVLHVAELARISLTDEEIEKYQVELKELLNDVEKINDVKGYDDDILIACWSDNTKLRKDEAGEMLDPKEVIGAAPRHSGNYIEVPVVISDGEGA